MSDTITGAPAANFIAGRWTPSQSGSVYERHNPWRPSEVVGEFPSSDAADVAAAVAAAQGARRDWARLPAAARGAYLSKAADAIEARQEEIAQDMTREMGKPLRESRGEAGRAAAILRFFAGEGLRPVAQLFEQSASGALVYTRRRPVGVVGLITPWNFPIAIPTWKTAPALAYGNTVVMKLAQDSPLTGLHLAAALRTGGTARRGAQHRHRPRRGRRRATRPAAEQVTAVSFTGSVPVGLGVREQATAAGKRVQLELGGHNPLIVADDAAAGRGRHRRLRGRVLVGRPEVHGHPAHVRAVGRLRGVSRAAAGADRRGKGRRSGRSGDRGGAARQSRSSSKRSWPGSSGAATRAARS